MVVFARCDFLEQTFTADSELDISIIRKQSNPLESSDDLDDPFSYKQIASFAYPVNVDDRSKQQIVIDEANFHIGRMMNMEERYLNANTDLFEIPLKTIFDFVYLHIDDFDLFRYKENNKEIIHCILFNQLYVYGRSIMSEHSEHKIVDEHFEIPPYQSSTESEDSAYDCDNLNERDYSSTAVDSQVEEEEIW